jgi:sialic acid synthase
MDKILKTAELANTSDIKVVAEIGCNHMGSIETAEKMIEVAKEFCGCDAVKFQKRYNSDRLNPSWYREPHPVSANSFGQTYGEHREFLEFDKETHRRLKEKCEDLGIIYATSVWDIPSAEEIVDLNPEYIKVPSASNLNHSLLDVLCNQYSGEIHISLGMTACDEEVKIIDYLRDKDALNRTVIYSCTSGYPVDHSELYLLEIIRLREKYQDEVRAVGFSGHHRGIAADIAAITLGANWVERHFSLDRTWKGTDHAASLEPDGMRRLVRDIRNIRKALATKPSRRMIETERNTRKKLKNPPKWMN